MVGSTQVSPRGSKVGVVLCLFTLLVPFLIADQAAGQLAVLDEASVEWSSTSGQAMATDMATGEEIYGGDPLGLVANYQITSRFGLSPDSFELWVCEVSGGTLELSVPEVIVFLEAEVNAYFAWLSNGKYQLTLHPGGTVAGDLNDCEEEVARESTGAHRGALLISSIDKASEYLVLGGIGTPGSICHFPSVNMCSDTYPSNGRHVLLYGFRNLESIQAGSLLSLVTDGIDTAAAAYKVRTFDSILHEIGHTLAFPHSYTGTTAPFHEREYDNPMDLLSGGPKVEVVAWLEGRTAYRRIETGLSATIAINRYAAGWISPEEVAVYEDGTSRYTLHALGNEGTQMLVVPSGIDGTYLAIGARVATGYDSLIPKEGIEVYLVDQRSTACPYPIQDTCWGLNRRTQPYPVVRGEPTAHVLGVSDTIKTEQGVTITVVERQGESFVVEVDDENAKYHTPSSYDEQLARATALAEFSDVPMDHTAVDAISWAFSENVTVGVGNGQFGIGQPLTREQMVTFLCRAYEPSECSNEEHRGSERFDDIPLNHWANSAIGWAVKRGVTAGVGPNTFGLGQTLPREQIVTFLYRAEQSSSYTTLGHRIYKDVPTNDTGWYQAPIGWAYSRGITAGIAKEKFGFGTPLSREEMVLFLCRAKAPGICGPSQETLSSSVITTPARPTELITLDPETVQSISAGGWHSCGIRHDGTATCWGSNLDGQSDPPSEIVLTIDTGADHSCAILTYGTVTCWGHNGEGRSNAPAGQFTAISAGGLHSCGIRTDGTVTCWGASAFGQSDAPSDKFTAISAGWYYPCGIRTDGTVTCWGDSSFGQSDAPAGQFTAISAVGSHSCGIRTDGTVTCWGYNAFGQSDAPAGQFTAITAGSLHSCGIRTDGTVTCWGYNAFGRSDAPAGQFTAITAGGLHSCGIRTDGTVTCWGSNVYGQTNAPSGRFQNPLQH